MFLDMKTINLPAKEKDTEFSKYLLERNPSEKFIRTYGIYLRSNVVKKYVQENSIPSIYSGWPLSVLSMQFANHCSR